MKPTPLLASLALALMLAQPAQAQTVAELFTSQSCSSCPPAESFFRDLSKRTDVIVLEWHVDYWNDLQTGAGRWKDPFSSSSNTTRQRAYNRTLNGKSGVYTPQAVISGATAAVGSDRLAVSALIRDASPLPIRITGVKAEAIRFSTGAIPNDADAWLITFRKSVATHVGGGENNGRKLSSANVVTGATRLKSSTIFEAPIPAAGDGCALIIQRRNAGPILGAAYCPE